MPVMPQVHSKTSVQPAIYTNLDASRSEIRLLVLPANDPGEGNHISASFRTASLDDPLEYYALSYVWGTPAKSHHVEVADNKVAITRVLDRILHMLLGHQRGPACVRGKAIWIDALCINQEDMLEKEHQIPLMGRIYHQATHVLLYLGEGDEHSDWAMARMNDPEFCASLSTLSITTRVPTMDEIRLKLVLDRNLEERPYWTRVWIMQELVLPRNPFVLCGQYCTPWARYVNCLQWSPGDAGRYPTIDVEYAGLKAQIPSLATGESSNSSYMHRILREAYWELGKDNMSLSALLSFTSFLRATDSRDYVFGILGMLCPGAARQIETTYLKSEAEVFKEAMSIVWREEHSKDLELFSFHRPATTPPQLPSWVPDLSNQWPPSVQKEKPGLQLRASWETWRPALCPRLIIEGNVLALEVIIFDSIELLEEEINFNYGWEPSLRYAEPYDTMIQPLKRAEALALQGRQRPILDDDRLFPFVKMRSYEPVWQTMSYWKRPRSHMPDTTSENQGHDSVWKSVTYADQQQIQLSDPGPLDGRSRLDREREALWEITMNRREVPKSWAMNVPPTAQDDELKSKAAILNPMLHAIRMRSNGRKVFLTKMGFFGIGSRNMEPGDIIVFVYGMQCIRILRPVDDRYLMIGFAYLSGTRDWHVLDECLNASHITSELINIV